MSEKPKHIEPKLLYERLIALFDSLELGGPVEPLITSFVGRLFETLATELHVSSILLYAEHHDGFELQHKVGAIDEIPTELIQPSLPVVKELEDSRFHLFAPTVRPGQAPPELNPGSAAAILVGDRPHRFLLFLSLGDGWVREDVEFSINTVRVALSSRLREERLRVTFGEVAAIQRSLLVEEPPSFDGFNLAVRSVAAEEVGGDFYDFIPFTSDHIGIAIGDACGHGLSAALVVRDVVTGLRMGLEKEFKVSHAIKKLNRVIHRSRLTSRFVSLFYGELEANGALIFVNAGHDPALLFLEDRMEELSRGGPIIGPIADATFQRGFAHVDRGAALILYTDGIVERRNAAGDRFGKERLVQLVLENKREKAQIILDHLFEACIAFGDDAPWEDDASVIVITRDPPSPSGRGLG